MTLMQRKKDALHQAIGRNYDSEGMNFSGGELRKIALAPPAGFVTKLQYLTTAVSYNAAPMIHWLNMKTANTASFGRHRRNIISKVRTDQRRLKGPKGLLDTPAGAGHTHAGKKRGIVIAAEIHVEEGLLIEEGSQLLLP